MPWMGTLLKTLVHCKPNGLTMGLELLEHVVSSSIGLHPHVPPVFQESRQWLVVFCFSDIGWSGASRTITQWPAKSWAFLPLSTSIFSCACTHHFLSAITIHGLVCRLCGRGKRWKRWKLFQFCCRFYCCSSVIGCIKATYFTYGKRCVWCNAWQTQHL